MSDRALELIYAVYTDEVGFQTHVKNPCTAAVLTLTTEVCTAASSTRMKVNSCSASSKLSKAFGCMNAFDGSSEETWATAGQGAGSWIKANFIATVTKFSYQHRQSKQKYWNKDIRLEFSDGSTQSYQLKAESGVQMFTLSKPVTTTFVKIVVVSHYHKSNNGAREIEFFGCPSDVNERTKKGIHYL